MNFMRVSWGMSAFVWFGFIVLTCVALGWPAVVERLVALQRQIILSSPAALPAGKKR